MKNNEKARRAIKKGGEVAEEEKDQIRTTRAGRRVWWVEQRSGNFDGRTRR